MAAAIDFYCSEHTLPQTYSCSSGTTTATSTVHCSSRHHSISDKLVTDHRRLAVLLEQEQRFMPNAYHVRKAVNESERMQLLETLLQIEAICPEPRKSDCYQLTVNLVDRYLGYRMPKVDELPVIICACVMISMKLRRATKECLCYHQLRHYFNCVSEQSIRMTEKKIANQLKWDLNAVTTTEFVEELSSRLTGLLPPDDLDKLTHHAHTIANVCLLYSSFISIPPSLLACACLCDAISFVAPTYHRKCVELLSGCAGVEQDVLLQHQKNVSDVIEMKIQSTCCQEELETATPTDIADLEGTEFTCFNFPMS